MATDEPSKPKALHLDDLNEVRKVFERFDANSDGKISAEELVGVLESLGTVTPADEVRRMMQAMDTDQDGQINLEDFAAFCEGNADPYKSEEKELNEAFELYDQDRDGKISAAELHQILTRLGEGCSEKDCAGMIKSVDSDGDGFVNLHEFKRMMSKTKNIAN